MVIKDMIKRGSYASLFNIILPILIILWAMFSSPNVKIPVISSQLLAIVLSISGIALVITGMLNLMYWGKGLPMNAYPPKYFVNRGVFRFIPHPIYTGAVISVAGLSILFQSSGGFWLVTPAFALGCTALVYGFEKEATVKRFGESGRHCLIRIPENTEDRAEMCDYISIYILVFLSWFILYEMVCMIGINERSISTFMDFEYSIPVFEGTEVIYAFTYPFILILPLIFSRKSELRKFCMSGIIITATGIFLQLVFPFMAPPKAFTPHGVLGDLLNFERGIDSAAAAFPSFHVIWAFAGAYFYSLRFGRKILWYAIAVIISVSCITTGMHSLIDVAAGVLTFVFVINIKKAALIILKLTEKIANSWHEWDFGRVRILNHGFYVGIGAAIGYMIISTISGSQYFLSVFFISIIIVVCAGLWAQLIEGSPRLSRPYGFYGGVIGAAIGILIIGQFSQYNSGILWGAFAVSAPWIQISGRFRCLVQGCCHRKEINSDFGIKFHHPRSRVTRLSDLADKPLHATQLYSIITNMITGLFLIRLWYENVSPFFIAGIYLMLNGLSRFVEESYRGEPQTPILWGLRLYQWMALATVICGAYMTTIISNPIHTEIHITAVQIILSTSIGVITFFAMGVDFPKSQKRFARLA